MSERDVRARVDAFVADYHRRWDRAGRPPKDPGDSGREVFEAWAAEVSELAGAHGVAGLVTGVEGSLSGLAAHDPGHETITDVQIDADQARVRSVMTANPPATYYEYRLAQVAGGWRITQILSFLDPPGAPLVDPSEAQRLLASARLDAPLPALPADLRLDVPSLFAEGREVTLHGRPAALRVERLGAITCGSGVVSVRDFGGVQYDLAPLARRIPAGTYPVEVAVAGGTNVALRLLLSDAPAVGWHPAEDANGVDAVGVDAANVAILDFAALVGCDAQHVEEVFGRESQRLGELSGSVFALDGGVPDAVLVTSGYGDGSYPCYWGVAADGSLASLVVDFLVLAEANVVTVQVPWQPGRVAAPELVECDLVITEDDGVATITHRGQVHNIRVLAPDGTLRVDGHRLGLRVDGDTSTQTWEPEVPPGPGSMLEVTLHRGYRHT